MSSLITENGAQPLTTPSEPSNGIKTQSRRRLCLTICTTRRPDLSEEEFGEYLINIHGPLSKGLLAKYGIIRWSMEGNIPWGDYFTTFRSQVQCRDLVVQGVIFLAQELQNSQTDIGLLMQQSHNTTETRKLL